MIGLQKGLFRLPAEKDTPLICVGPGTGVAPMRAIIEDRIHHGATSKVSHAKMLAFRYSDVMSQTIHFTLDAGQRPKTGIITPNGRLTLRIALSCTGRHVRETDLRV